MEHKSVLAKLLLRSRDGCHLGLEGIVSKKLTSSYCSGPSKKLDQGRTRKRCCNSRPGWHVL